MSLRAILRFLPVLALAGLTLLATPSRGEAQFGKRLKDAVQRTAEDKAINKATEEESRAIDKAVSGRGNETARADAATAGTETPPAALGKTAKPGQRRGEPVVEREAAVRQFLVDNYQVDAARLAAKGLGQTNPAASNDTPEGRQNNRRVELVKM
jgi:hypothetical protein